MSDDEESSVGADSDPFEKLESDVAGRKGDPFESLSGSVTSNETDATSAGLESTGRDADGWGESGSQSADGGDREDEFSDGSAGTDDFEPTTGRPELSELADSTAAEEGSRETASPERNLDVGRRREELSDAFGDVGDREGDPFEKMDSLFEERDTETIDPDSVWQDLTSPGSGSANDHHERTFADVSKHSYCEQCRYFSSPPDVACTHEGTDIVEFLDMETVRVVDCPIVAERQDLEREG